jgi:hypothetical protein
VLAQPPEKTSSEGAAAALLGCWAGSYCGGSKSPPGKGKTFAAPAIRVFLNDRVNLLHQTVVAGLKFGG